MPKLGGERRVRDLTEKELEGKTTIETRIQRGECLWVMPNALYQHLSDEFKEMEGKSRAKLSQQELQKAFEASRDPNAIKHAERINDKNDWYKRTHDENGNKISKGDTKTLFPP